MEILIDSGLRLDVDLSWECRGFAEMSWMQKSWKCRGIGTISWNCRFPLPSFDRDRPSVEMGFSTKALVDLPWKQSKSTANPRVLFAVVTW